MGQRALDHGRQAFTGILIAHIQNAKGPAIMGAVVHEIVALDMVRILGSQSHARAIVEPQASAFELSGRNLQALLLPDPFHPFVIHWPSFTLQERGDPAIAISSVLTGKRHYPRGKLCFVIRHLSRIALCGAWLPHHPAGSALGHAQRGLDMLDDCASPVWADQFFDSTSFKMALSSVKSATTRLNRAFSCSNSFKRRA